MAPEELGSRPFSFYPAIVNVEHNEWRFRRASWSEVLVVNTKTADEVWIPRQYWGDVSVTDDPFIIVGLRKELEYKAGSVWPHERRVIQMPRAVNDSLRPAFPEAPAQPAPAPVVGIRTEVGAESRIGLFVGSALVLGIVACVVVIGVFRVNTSGARVEYSPVLRAELGLTAEDDYYAVVRKLGSPEQDSWRAAKGEMQVRKLTYPKLSLSVILMGVEREQIRYIGALDNNWRVVHAVKLPSGADSSSMLRGIKPF
jgi:hypothetical protein